MDSDFMLDESGDIIFTPDGDIDVISGNALILQDIREELSIPLGSIEWDPDAGSEMTLFLNDVNISEQTIITELERVAFKDIRIAADSVKAEKTGENKFKLQFTTLVNQEENEIILIQGENNG
jgi:hypothetical protein